MTEQLLCAGTESYLPHAIFPTRRSSDLAALGMSEVSDALTIVVSEETGQVSVAMGGQLVRGITPEYLSTRLSQIQFRASELKKFNIWKGRHGHEEV